MSNRTSAVKPVRAETKIEEDYAADEIVQQFSHYFRFLLYVFRSAFECPKSESLSPK